MTVFNAKQTNHAEAKLFLDDALGMQRYETLKYRQIDKLTDKQLGFFWRPEEVDILRDAKDFRSLTPHEQHIFTSNLKRQIVLDSVQGRSPNLAFLPHATLSELEAWIETWSFSEIIHSKSYTHIIRNVYSDPTKVFDEISSIDEIIDLGEDISKYYDDLIEYGSMYNLYGEGRVTVTKDGETTEHNISKYELKRKLWMAMMAVNVLEGVRFYVSFACSWAFAELKKMEGNAKIIKLICRDENLHLAFSQTCLKLLVNEDKDFAKIAQEMQSECVQLYVSAVEQEKQWAEYLFRDGSMIGLNVQLLADYIEWIANKRMTAVGLPSPYKVPQANPLPWTQKWISGSEVQVAPQETEITSYISGGTKQDIDDTTFKGFSL